MQRKHNIKLELTDVDVIVLTSALDYCLEQNKAFDAFEQNTMKYLSDLICEQVPETVWQYANSKLKDAAAGGK